MIEFLLTPQAVRRNLESARKRYLAEHMTNLKKNVSLADEVKQSLKEIKNVRPLRAEASKPLPPCSAIVQAVPLVLSPCVVCGTQTIGNYSEFPCCGNVCRIMCDGDGGRLATRN